MSDGIVFHKTFLLFMPVDFSTRLLAFLGRSGSLIPKESRPPPLQSTGADIYIAHKQRQKNRQSWFFICALTNFAFIMYIHEQKSFFFQKIHELLIKNSAVLRFQLNVFFITYFLTQSARNTFIR